MLLAQCLFTEFTKWLGKRSEEFRGMPKADERPNPAKRFE